MHRKVIISIALLATPLLATAGGLNGPFLGAFVGTVNGDDNGYEIATNTGVPDGWSESNSLSGLTVGLAGGYNWLLSNNLLFGLDASYEQRSADAKSYQTNNITGPDTRYPYYTELDSAYSFMAKIGYAFNQQRTAAYLKAGISVADIKRTINDITIPASQSKSESLNGNTFGIGVEHLITNSISMSADYSSTKYDNSDMDVNSVWTNTTEKLSYEEKEIKVGVSYRF